MKRTLFITAYFFSTIALASRPAKEARPNVPAPQTVDFSSRLSRSFNTTPLGRTQERIVTLKRTQSSEDFESEQKLRDFRCAQGDKKCLAEMEELVKKSRTPEATPLNWEPLGK